MKIIAILTLCLTASLSFTHSEILDKTNDDAFTYDYSRICEKGCFRFILDTAYDPYGLTNPLIDPFDFTFQISSEPDPEAEYIKYAINKLTSKMKYGFPSTTDANAYFNIYILNNTPNNQLGYLRWRTYKFSNSIKSYMINFGATITEQAALLFPLDQSSISFDIYDLSEFQCSNSELITRIHGNPCPIEYSNKILKKYGLLTQADTISYDYSKLCNDSINCQFIKRSDICDTSSHILRSSDIYTAFSDECNPYMSSRYIPLELPGFSSETDAKINIQIFDSPAFLENEQNHNSWNVNQ